jgi:signal transduction histidine kinase
MPAVSARDGARFAPSRWPRAAVIASTGLFGALLILVGGWVDVRLNLGGDVDTQRQHIETEVQATFTALATALRETGRPLAEPRSVEAAGQGDANALRALFDRAADALASDSADERALTVFDGSGEPLAWAGRPSELPLDRLNGAEVWFLAQGALGLRLVHAAPVVGADGRRVGTVSTERVLDVVLPDSGEPGEFVLLSTNVPVSISPIFDPGRAAAAGRFIVSDPAGQSLLIAAVSDADLSRSARRRNSVIRAAAVSTVAITVLLLCGPLLAWRGEAGTRRADAVVLLACAINVVTARALLRVASPVEFSSADLFSRAAYASSLAAPMLTSPFDFLLSGLAATALLLLAITFIEARRLWRRAGRSAVDGWQRSLPYIGIQSVAGASVLAIFLAHRFFVSDTIANTALDLLHFSLHPWDAARLALQVGFVLWHAVALGAAVLVLRAAMIPWRLPRRPAPWLGTVFLWLLPWIVWRSVADPGAGVPLLATLLTAAVIASLATRLIARYRHGSQVFRLLLLALVLIVPALVCYPVVFAEVAASKRSLVETRYAPQAIFQRQTIQRVLQESLLQIDALPALDDLVAATTSSDGVDTESAFELWRATGLAAYPITSSVEIFGGDGRLVSRFAFNLPDDLTTTPRSDEDQCGWTTYEEVSPFFAEERRVLHAGRAVCAPGTADAPPRLTGAIVVHAILDYANLPFIASQSPYVELLRPGNAQADESLSGQDLEYAVYGWSGRPLYASNGTAWPLAPEALRIVAASRTPFWATLGTGGSTFSVYLLNDRGGIYALGFPVLSTVGHLVNLAELVVLACVAGLILVPLTLALDLARGSPTSGPALLREIRASFYRKLFLAFVAASVVPVVTLAVLTRNYIADQLRTSIEHEAVRTVAAAKRVVEDLVVPRSATTRDTVDDNLMVWVSRLIDQDVNIFRGARLQATSERNLFASGVLATRTPADVYRALVLRRDATAILTDQIGSLTYLVAATPLLTRQFDGMLTVPLTLRQRDIEEQIDTLNRLVLLGAMLFILAGAGIGYSMAERIADPVNRLTRATRRIARGDLAERVTTSSSDELGRLVADFNRMAEDLETQRAELERTHRLEAWAEMARQVAHEIKNPLTPIQLNAEHLRRVHADRGKPLSPVLDECVSNILMQVSLLRTIASEFSSFASVPVVHRAPTSVVDLVNGIVTPYRSALQGRIAFTVNLSPDLPPVLIDRTLLARAFTNIVENALHAMPAGGQVTVTARAVGEIVTLDVADSGGGMSADALARAFEPYFSTKVTGTGLGLPIAKRNVESSGGTIEIRSVVGEGTTVTLTLPIA